MSERSAWINAVAGVTPPHDVHQMFVDWAGEQVEDERTRRLFHRMACRAGIEHRWSVLPPVWGDGPHEPGSGFYLGEMPPTSARMAFYAEEAPKLALRAIEKLGEGVDLSGVTHLIVASCTGFVAPGVDQIIARHLGLTNVERTLVGFMGCYAAVSALRVGHHIVRSRPDAKVLVVTVELCSLHLRKTQSLESLLAMLQFSDGAAAALLSAEPWGFEMTRQFSAVVEESAGLIQWKIGDGGFEMTLSGEVPGRIQRTLATDGFRAMLFDRGEAGAGDGRPDDRIDSWAVHAGGRSILDAVESGLDLPPDALSASREVLSQCGNMSSSTLMFVLASLLNRKSGRRGIAIAFGPGMAAEGFHFLRED